MAGCELTHPRHSFSPMWLDIPICIEQILLFIYSFAFPSHRAFERETFGREVECAVIIFLARLLLGAGIIHVCHF